MKKYIFLFLLLPAFMLLFAGCLPKKKKGPVKTQTLTLSSYPQGAAAHIAGKIFDLPHDFRLAPGSYLFRIEKPGYAPSWFSCKVLNSGIAVPKLGTDGNVTWEKMSPQSTQIELTRQGGTVLLQSTPDTAQIFKDGRELGVTPLVLTDLPVGQHDVLLKSPNYADVTVSWEIRNNSPLIIHTDMQSNIGKLHITSKPSQARLFIDGKHVGQTAFRGTYAVGNHAIRLERDGYQPYEDHIVITKGKLTEKHVPLVVSPCMLNITSEPSGAQVFLNDQLRGTTPLILKDLPAGSYKIAVAHDGYDQMEETLDLAAGSSTRKDFIMSSSQGGIELNVYPAGVRVFLNGRDIGTVQQGESQTQTRLLQISNLSPGTYIVKAVHKRADPEIRKIRVQKGKIARPARIDLWVPNAEITWKDTGRTEVGMIYGETDRIILFGAQKGIRYEVDKKLLKSIKLLDINE